MHQTEPGVRFLLAEKYVVRHDASVARFLADHSFLTDVLRAAPVHIRACFPECPLLLEVVSDPDAEHPEQVEHLVVFVATDLDVPEAMARLQCIEESWWLEAMPSARGALSIDLLFV